MWFKHGLKLQKLLAQGIPWVSRGCPSAPCKGKSLEYMLLYNQFYLGFARNYFSFKSFADFSKSALISSNSGFLFSTMIEE